MSIPLSLLSKTAAAHQQQWRASSPAAGLPHLPLLIFPRCLIPFASGAGDDIAGEVTGSSDQPSTTIAGRATIGMERRLRRRRDAVHRFLRTTPMIVAHSIYRVHLRERMGHITKLLECENY